MPPNSPDDSDREIRRDRLRSIVKRYPAGRERRKGGVEEEGKETSVSVLDYLCVYLRLCEPREIAEYPCSMYKRIYRLVYVIEDSYRRQRAGDRVDRGRGRDRDAGRGDRSYIFSIINLPRGRRR